ncbi:uncharacterized protein LOC129570395 [Sitodiplosis mosellana]|uniref:uncharacterized protein LOC129570395 n=1 Tax=Sitodiplosis mosellana TaxID=263140 RepID=UPI0024450AD1|nr:uncharacterized protein LOC129570395 [Sitodiplosis mosellana]
MEDMKENLDQILLMYEVGIESEIEKTVAAFEATTPPMNPAFASCFFEVLKNRMNETLRKAQLVYLASLNAAADNANETSPDDSSDVLLISVTTNDSNTSSTDASVKEETPVVEVASAVEKTQTVEESIEAAIAEILSNANEEMPNNTNERADDIETVENGHTDDTEKVENGHTDTVEKVINEQSNAVEKVTNEQTDEIASSSVNMDESKNRDESPESNQVVTPESPLATPENEHSTEPALKSETNLPEEETISNCSQVDSSTSSEEVPFLGFEASAPMQCELNLLKRKEAEALEVGDGRSKKRKISREMEESRERDGKEDGHEGEEEEGGNDGGKECENEGGKEVKMEEDIDQQVTNDSRPEDGVPECDQLDRVCDTSVQSIQSQFVLYQNDTIPSVYIDNGTPKNYNTEQPVDTSNVFVSRLSPHMVPRMLRRSDCSICKDGLINAFCFLCEKNLTSMTYDSWKEHVLKHTNEMQFYCTECRTPQSAKEAHGNCPVNKVTDIFDTDSCSRVVKAHMCKWCNYIQVHKSRMTAHFMEHQHNALDPNFNRNILSVTLLPDLEALTWSIEPFAFVAEQNRFVCSIENCSGEYVNGNEFKRHFQQYHSTHTSFMCPHCDKMIEKKNRQLITNICNHFQLHGGHLYKCCLCEMVTGYEYDMLQHMARFHYGEKARILYPYSGHVQLQGAKLTYRYIKKHGQGEIEKQECTIWFQCNVCDARFEHSNEANDHFIKAHKSYYLDFEVVKMVKRTIVDGVTSCFTPVEKKKFVLRRSLNCKLCNQMPKTRSALIEHFNRDHPMHEIAVKLGHAYMHDVSRIHNYKEFSVQNLTFDTNIVYYCATCRDANQSASVAFMSVNDVHAHWFLTHANTPAVRPFQFYAIEFVSCFYCDLIASFYEVKRHHDEVHSQKPLIITSVLDNKKCALCDYTGHDLADHMKIEHELVLRSIDNNPNRFTDETLNKLLAIDIHKKHKCAYCVKVCETLGEIKSHIIHDHRMQIKYETFFDSHSVKIVAGCCQSIIDLHEFLNHLADPNHTFPSTCGKCNFRTNEMLDFVDHQVNVHQITKDADSLYRRLLQTRFWKTSVIFGNGFMCNKHNLLGTEFDDSKPFAELVEQMLNISRQRINARELHDEYDE